MSDKLSRPVDKLFSLDGRRVWVAGHTGMVGSALVRRLAQCDCETITAGRQQLDLLDPVATRAFLAAEKPDLVFLAAARVGGIAANMAAPASFLHENMMIACNVIDAARRAGTRKLVALGSSCIYPRLAPQPISESVLLSGPLEPTNEAYAIAKIAGLKLAAACRIQYGCDFISAMPTNLYGPGDNFDAETSHVVPALIRKFHTAVQDGAPTVTVWGSGTPRREFLHVDDCADALVHLAEFYSGELAINVGTGVDTTIRDLAECLAELTGYTGELMFDETRPDGTPRKLLDVSRLRALGWAHRIALRDGLAETCRWYAARHDGAPDCDQQTS
ncbi:MAG: GDP-L-fucose synthase [Pseudomonadota bacterium]